MVEAVLIAETRILLLNAKIITYGNGANPDITRDIAMEIEEMWNEPNTSVIINRLPYTVRFNVAFDYDPGIDPDVIIRNLDPQFNFYRIESYAPGNISYVDGLGSNTGYFLTDNLYKGSTTAAHEFGHGLGLDHPRDLDIRGKGRPGIMYPRGTWVDPEFQYDSTAKPGEPGGTMHPQYRKVRNEDIQMLRLDRLRFKNNKAVVGDFSNFYHEA